MTSSRAATLPSSLHFVFMAPPGDPGIPLSFGPQTHFHCACSEARPPSWPPWAAELEEGEQDLSGRQAEVGWEPWLPESRNGRNGRHLCRGRVASGYQAAASPNRGAPPCHWPWSLGHLEGVVMVKKCAFHCTVRAFSSVWLGEEWSRGVCI